MRSVKDIGTMAILASALMLTPTLTGAAEMNPKPIDLDTLDQLQWNARPIVVLGEGGMVAAQMLALKEAWDALSERDVVVFTDGPGAEALSPDPGDAFAVLLIGKDGSVKQRWSSKVDPSEIIDLIDSMPMRQQEAKEDDPES